MGLYLDKLQWIKIKANNQIEITSMAHGDVLAE